MESTVIKLQRPARHNICSVCERKRHELWYIDTDTDALVCDLTCKSDLDLATEVIRLVLSSERSKFRLAESKIADSVEKALVLEASSVAMAAP